MGSKDSFAGGGGPIGDDLRDGIDDWLASLPGSPGDDAPAHSGDTKKDSPQRPTLPGTGPMPLSPKAKRVAKTALLFRTASGTGSSARKGTSAQFPRSAATSARTAGRGAAAAYAYRTGDAETLKELGLDYDALLANPNVFDVVHQIVGAICEELPDQIESDEQRFVVAEVAEWVVTTNTGGPDPTPAEIAQETLAIVLTWAYLTTTAGELNTKDLAGPERVAFEIEVRAACEELSAQVNLNPTNPTANEFVTAVESGLEHLQAVYGSDNE
ncbi:MAG: hypothetical protein L0H59_05005 [Tomitella sp.]|uniref:hypothetical protein n=1 Tax=Intrasporangium sp. TaxID=1925024 RepID=UPI002649248D|nr:hypothetical protein [Intrasporangium sp.]MDN5757877.1 hypothetical protein [Tomitella sp.]MDN5797781.1 hypothetical protein [Intrasporangium sp.]